MATDSGECFKEQEPHLQHSELQQQSEQQGVDAQHVQALMHLLADSPAFIKLQEQLSLTLSTLLASQQASLDDYSQQELSSFKERYAKQNQQLLDAQQELVKIKHQVVELQDELAHGVSKQQSLLDTTAQLREEKANLVKENQSLGADLAKQKHTNESWEEKLAALSQESQDSVSMQMQLEALEAENTACLEQIAHYETLVNKQNQQLLEQASRIENVQQTDLAHSAQLQALEQQSEQISQTLAQEKEKTQQQQNENQLLHNELQKQHDEYAQLQSQLAQTQQELGTLEIQLGKIPQLEQQLRELAEQQEFKIAQAQKAQQLRAQEMEQALREQKEHTHTIAEENAALEQVLQKLKENIDEEQQNRARLKAHTHTLEKRLKEQFTRNESLRNRFDADLKQARQAFDTLRAEHLSLKAELEQTHEKMMEYKLKFDYAQRQLQS